MKLYHSSFSNTKSDDVLKHFGELQTSFRRLNSMFMTKNRLGFDGVDFIRFDYHYNPTERCEPNSILQDFIAYLASAKIECFEIEAKNPLRLKDAWEDDPIGSAGLAAFEGSDQLSELEKQSLKRLFAPFEDIIYPHDVFLNLSTAELKNMRNYVRNNPFAKKEFEKRKSRSMAIGEDFNVAATQEYVWVYLMMKLRQWALERRYDSFVYANTGEGFGDDAYVTLKSGQAGKPVSVYSFDKDSYMSGVASEWNQWINKLHQESTSNPSTSNFLSEESKVMGDQLMWGGQDPMKYWHLTRL